jgi:predicted lipoprotein with Yx(FWY)xxD motif
MKTRLRAALAGTAVAMLALAGCAGGAPAPSPTESSDAEAAPDITVAGSSIGEIVVNGEGMTAYVFDKDTVGADASACTGDCEALWPAITSESDTPVVDGITGTVGTITGVAGGKQITINGLPIYTFAQDTAPGDLNGQGLNEVWHVIAPDGTAITTAP